MKKIFGGVLFLLVFSFSITTVAAQIAMSSENWESDDAGIRYENYLGQPSMFMKTGTALKKISHIEDGVVEVDIAPSPERKGFAGIVFRTQSGKELEVVYLRLFKSGLSDAVQYTPRYKDVDCWQLYTSGYMAAANFKEGEWTHLKLEIEGRTARIYINNAATPNLIVKDLKRDEGKGAVGLWASGGAYFANFNYKSRPLAAALPVPINQFPKGTITGWEISQVFPFVESSFENYPGSQQLSTVNWEKLNVETLGFLNLSRYRQKERVDNESFNHSTDFVYARKKIVSPAPQLKKLLFGYSDRVSIFLNGKIVFSGNSSFRSRDSQFLGAIGLNDAIFLNLQKGENDLLFVIPDRTGGWGVQAQFVDPSGISF